ncbi:MAG: hypothetical protein M0Z85_04320, partial [Gammaproteobacteria bacterium]|nr:hypothetical protein [Gammaproteobacteria bacterium]
VDQEDQIRWEIMRQAARKTLIVLVPEAGLEPAHPYGRGILSLKNLPFHARPCTQIRDFVPT